MHIKKFKKIDSFSVLNDILTKREINSLSTHDKSFIEFGTYSLLDFNLIKNDHIELIFTNDRLSFAIKFFPASNSYDGILKKENYKLLIYDNSNDYFIKIMLIPKESSSLVFYVIDFRLSLIQK